MRIALKKVYNGEKWRLRVSKMPEYQIVALYYKFLKQGKLKGA